MTDLAIPLAELHYTGPWPAEYDQFLRISSVLMEKFVAFGTHLITWADNAGGKQYRVPPVLLLRHVLESADAIAVCLASGANSGLKPICRSMMESISGLEYMLEANQCERGMAYLVTDIHARLKLHRQCDPSTTEGKQFQRAWENDRLAGGVTLSKAQRDKMAEQSRKMVKRLEALLEDSEYAPIEEEWQRTKRKRHRVPAWYSLFDGPQSIWDLYKHLGHEAWYDTLYRPWSGSVHASDVFHNMLPAGNGRSYYRHIRDPQGIDQIASHAATFCMRAINLIVDNYCPDRKADFAQWYVKAARDHYMYVTHHPPFSVSLNSKNET